MSEDIFHLGIKGLIKNDDGEILLLQVNPKKLGAGQNYWDLPGGRVQQGQTPLETLKREIEEETGLAKLSGIEHVGMVPANIRIPAGEGSIGLILSIYECDVPGDAKIKLSDEHIASKWLAPAEAAKLLEIKYPKDFCDIVAGL